MKLTKTTIIALIAAGGLLALSPALQAQDAGKDAKKDEKAAEGKGGKRGGRLSIEQLTEQLKLTDEQKPKVQAALDERSKKMQELRDAAPAQEERRTKMQALQEEFGTKMKGILTAEQYKQFEPMLQRGGRGGRDGEKKAGDEKKAN